MSYKPDDITRMDYLEGELSFEENKRFEEYLENHPEERKLVAQLKATRSMLGQLKDKKVDVPDFVIDQPKVVALTPKNRYFGFIMGIAASLLILMLFGYVTNFNLKITNGNVFIGFANSGYSKEEAEDLIATALAKQKGDFDLKMASLEKETKDLVMSQVATINHQPTVSNQYLSREQLNQLTSETQKIVLSLLERSESSQREFTAKLVNDLALYLEVQRDEDLQQVQARIETIIDDNRNDIARRDALLTSLVSNSSITQTQIQY